jgi:hypothetical protein
MDLVNIVKFKHFNSLKKTKVRRAREIISTNPLSGCVYARRLSNENMFD